MGYIGRGGEYIRGDYIKYIILGFLHLYYILPNVNAYNVVVVLTDEEVNATVGWQGVKVAKATTNEATEDSYYGTDWERMDKEFEKFLGEGGEGGESQGDSQGENRGRKKGSNMDKE